MFDLLWLCGWSLFALLCGRDGEDSAFLASPLQFGLMMFTAGLMFGSQLAERFASGQPQQDTPR
ncbi:hypothetical protein [Streptomyces sp. T028]|uniref:hypothetical protein n=1 Tax=Streptomyces sp. T028 TaxID=3394379 RepID=UPI003A84066F